MKKVFLNRKLFPLHSWLGLFLGIFYLLISVSGAISVFRFELNSLIYGRKMEFAADPSKKSVSYDSIFSIARREFPGMPYYVCGFDEVYTNKPAFYSGVDHVTPKLFSPSMQYRVNYLDPYTAEAILRTDSKGKNNVIDWIMGFHYTFALGEGGELFVVLLDLALLVSIITGVIFYRRYVLKVLCFKVKIRLTNWRLASSGLHRVIGTWAMLFNLLIFLSGLYIQKKFFVERWWDKYAPAAHAGSGHVHPITYPLSAVSLDSLILVSAKMAPRMHVQGVTVNCGGGGVLSVFGSIKESPFLAYDNAVSVNFDRAGHYLGTDYTPWRELTTAEKMDDINFSLFHTGWALGKPGKVIWCIMGFTPAVLSLTGFMLWWRKKKGTWKAKG
jgi:uncharacterized iron-regulated membrane protein